MCYRKQAETKASRKRKPDLSENTMTNTTPPRHESASAPARSHRHPFLQARRQPHQHAPAGHEAGDNASALDVTAAEKRQHHHHVDVEGGGGAPSMPSPASPLVVAPAPGDPAHPLNDGESHEGDDEVRSVLSSCAKENSERASNTRESERDQLR